MTNTNRRRFPILLASALALLAILGALFLPDRAQAQSTTEIWSGHHDAGADNHFGGIGYSRTRRGRYVVRPDLFPCRYRLRH